MALGDGVSAITNLGVTFGGFSPTVVDGIANSKRALEQFNKLNRERKEALKRKRDLDFARTSKQRTVTFDNGDSWTYVVVDDSVIRLLKYDGSSSLISIPSEIEGIRVYGIGPDALSGNDYVEEILCPDGIESIGACAFRHNYNLKKIVFPNSLAEYNSSWISHCDKLEELVLPGLLDKLTLSVFQNHELKTLHIGKSIHTIEPGAFQGTQLERIVIDPENPFIKSDGMALYSADWTVLLALALPVSSYSIRTGCKELGKKCCCRLGNLKSIEFPEGIEVIGEFAFAHSSIESFVAPKTLREIGEKSFYHCKDLTSVSLQRGLETVCDSAFEESGISELQYPASIAHIGASVTARTNVIHSGRGCTLSIEEGCEKFFLDGEGGLYRHAEDGSHMVQLIDPDIREYCVSKGTAAIDDYAFAFHGAIEFVEVPDSVLSIGKSAFRICRRLRQVNLPDTVVSIGPDAFLDTELESIRIPAQLKELGRNALVTYGAHHGQQRPSLSSVEVSPDNTSFYAVNGMLCRKTPKGSNVVIYTSSEREVVIPEEVTHIEEYAFNNAHDIDYLELNPNLETIGTAGLTTWCWIRHIHVEVSKPIEGRLSFDFFFPNTPRSLHCISVGIGGASWVNVPGIMAQYDVSIASARDYNAPRSSDNISAYEQAKLILARLSDPIMLTPTNKGIFERLLNTYIKEICVDIARHDDREAIDALVDGGFLNADNLESVITRVNVLQDAAMTAYLLEIKRMRFSMEAIDFDL